jgi:hypothetical protein
MTIHQGDVDNYLHEAAQANNPPSGTFYDPEGDGTRLPSLGVHEHWNNAANRQYSRNLGGSEGIELLQVTDAPAVAGRHIFYNHSAFDGDDAAAGAADDAAIATDKAALLPGHTATFANYTSYSRGINGVMVDIQGLPGTPTAADFTFKVGNDNSPAGWAAAPAPSSITVCSGAGTGGSSRVTILWADGAIAGQWLQVTVLATANTGLSSPDVFYFGSAVGETGDNPANAEVTPADEVAIRNGAHTMASNPAGVTDPCDINRDRKVGPTDQVLCRNHGTNSSTALNLISVP